MRGGMIIRLIDVVLIILFGFLAISDIQMRRQIRMPGPSDEQKLLEEKKDVYIFVKIDNQGQFAIEMDQTELFASSDLSKLRERLVNIADDTYGQGLNPIVIIDPALDASVQSVISVFDICEEEQLPKSINVQLAGKD
jgi:biopolymer transport protein ExbD